MVEYRETYTDMNLAKYILSKLKEGWPHNLTNWDKTYCKVPTEEKIQQWITEWNNLK